MIFNRELNRDQRYQEKEKSNSEIYRSVEDGKRFCLGNIPSPSFNPDLKPLEWYIENDPQNHLLLPICKIDYNTIFAMNALKVKSYIFSVYVTIRHLRSRNIPITADNIKIHNIDKHKINDIQLQKSLLFLCQQKFITTKETNPNNLLNANFTISDSIKCFERIKKLLHLKNNFYNQTLLITKYTIEYYKTLSSESTFLNHCNAIFINNTLFERPVTYSEIQEITGLDRYHFKDIKSLSKRIINTTANLAQTDSDLLLGTEHLINRQNINAKIQTKTIYQKDFNSAITIKNKYVQKKFPCIDNVYNGNKDWNNLVESHNKLNFVIKNAPESDREKLLSLAYIIYSRKCHSSNFAFFTDGAKFKYQKRWEKTVITNTDFKKKLLYKGYRINKYPLL